MTELSFCKYHGTGNDFILVDDRSEQFAAADYNWIQYLCRRHFGIGADGLILLRSHSEVLFEMRYYNADGRPGTMCGNGGRCVVAFAHRLGLCSPQQLVTFEAPDGRHTALLSAVPDATAWVSISMAAVRGIDTFGSGTYVLNTGSPHYVQLVPDAATVDVALQGRAIRYSIPYAEQGINVNFVSVRSAGTLYVRTYERGVEAETLSCGTGVTASALAYATQHPNLDKVHVHTRGGSLEVRFRRHPQQQDVFEDIYLSGAVQHVFDGVWVAR